MAEPGSPPRIVVMGVSGCGKSTVGLAIAQRLDLPFLEGDDLHPQANRDKMQAAVPLDDADRVPWLDAVADWIAARAHDGAGAVIACSALRRCYRDRLRRADPDLRFVLLATDAATLGRRLDDRQGHFMPARLLASQLALLEPPTFDERALVLSATAPVDALCAQAVHWLEQSP